MMIMIHGTVTAVSSLHDTNIDEEGILVYNPGLSKRSSYGDHIVLLCFGIWHWNGFAGSWLGGEGS